MICPEVKDVVGPHLFGYNKKTHIMHFIIYPDLCCGSMDLYNFLK